jgi:hypothetical protein
VRVIAFIPKTDDPLAYAEALRAAWRRGEPFINVEHDIVAPPSALQSLAACPEPWCAYRYDVGQSYEWGLGCMKFGAPLLPLLDCLIPTHWRYFDQRIYAALRAWGYRAPHIHEPPVYHDKQSALDYPPTCSRCGRALPLPLAEYRRRKPVSCATSGVMKPALVTWCDSLAL